MKINLILKNEYDIINEYKIFRLKKRYIKIFNKDFDFF